MRGRRKKMGGGGEAGGLSLCLSLPVQPCKRKRAKCIARGNYC